MGVDAWEFQARVGGNPYSIAGIGDVAALTEVVTRQGSQSYRAFTEQFENLVKGLFAVSGFPGQADAQRLTQELSSLIRTFWPSAWADGIKPFGLTMGDLTGLELFALESAISRDVAALPGFSQFVLQNNWRTIGDVPSRRTSPDRWREAIYGSPQWSKIQARIRLWWNGYHRIESEARQLAAGDRLMMWILGPTEQHCPDCSKYAGRVYRGSTWAKWDVRPQHPRLACHGFNCQCRLQITTEPVTPGRPPRMTG